MRTRDYRRTETERVIRKRLENLKSWRTYGTLEYFLKRRSKLAKFNLKCTCGMCKRPRYCRAREKHLLRASESPFAP